MLKLLTVSIVAIALIGCKPNAAQNATDSNGRYLVYKVDDQYRGNTDSITSALKDKFSNVTFAISFTSKYVTIKKEGSSTDLVLAKDQDTTYSTTFNRQADSLQFDIQLRTGVKDTILQVTATSLKAMPHSDQYGLTKYGRITCYLSKTSRR